MSSVRSEASFMVAMPAGAVTSLTIYDYQRIRQWVVPPYLGKATLGGGGVRGKMDANPWELVQPCPINLLFSSRPAKDSNSF